MATTSVAQANDLEGVTINFSGISRRQENSGAGLGLRQRLRPEPQV
jgi:hypothetical protein